VWRGGPETSLLLWRKKIAKVHAQVAANHHTATRFRSMQHDAHTSATLCLLE
jgi:hypothetical protein